MRKCSIALLVCAAAASCAAAELEISQLSADQAKVMDLYSDLAKRVSATNAALAQTNYGPISFKDSWGTLVTNAYVTRITLTNLTYRIGTSAGGTLKGELIPDDVREHFQVWHVQDVIVKLALQANIQELFPSRRPVSLAAADAAGEFGFTTAWKVTEKNSVYWRVSFVVNIANRAPAARYAFFTIRFVDAKGFTLDDHPSGRLTFKAGEVKQWSEYALIEPALASKITSVRVSADD